MNFDWAEYAELAGNLISQAAESPIKEALYRSAISRAYYAAFIQCRNELRDKRRLLFTHEGIHQKVAQAMERYNLEASQKLKRLFSDRKKADYEDHIPNLDFAKAARSSLMLHDSIVSCLPL